MSAQAERGTRKRRSAASPEAETAEAMSPRTGAKRTVMDVIKQIPVYLRLLYGLLRDRRVNLVDKLLVLGAVAYIVSPADFIPDFIPFLGQVDDIFLLMASLERLIRHAGRAVVLSHWEGDPGEISLRNLEQVLMAAAFFLPKRIRRRLKRRMLG